MNIRDRILALESEYKQVKAMLRTERQLLEDAKENLDACLEAQKLIQETAADVQTKVHAHIATIVTRCLKAVFTPGYEFKIHFEQKRGKTEARMVFLDHEGNEVNPTEECGGGVIDVAAFALRIAALLLSKPRPEKILILDEPFRFLGGTTYRNHLRQLLASLHEELHFQFIIVTHDPDFEAGRVYEIK